MTRTATAQKALRHGENGPATRTVATADGNAHTIPIDPPVPTMIGSYPVGEEEREVAVEPAGDGAWTVTDRASGPNGEPVEVETLARYVDDPLSEAVALAVDYLHVAADDPDRRVRRPGVQDGNRPASPERGGPA